MDWNNVVSAVATEEGLLVTEKAADGTLGATSYLMPYGNQPMYRAQAVNVHLPYQQLPPPQLALSVADIQVARKLLLSWAGSHPLDYYSSPQYALPSWYTNAGYTLDDEGRANGFVAWWNKYVAGKPAGNGLTHGALLTCGSGPNFLPTGYCTVLSQASFGALKYWAQKG